MTKSGVTSEHNNFEWLTIHLCQMRTLFKLDMDENFWDENDKEEQGGPCRISNISINHSAVDYSRLWRYPLTRSASLWCLLLSRQTYRSDGDRLWRRNNFFAISFSLIGLEDFISEIFTQHNITIFTQFLQILCIAYLCLRGGANSATRQHLADNL